MFGVSYDWSREVATSDPSFYKFTQWMFARMHESWYDDHCRWQSPSGDEVVGRRECRCQRCRDDDPLGVNRGGLFAVPAE